MRMFKLDPSEYRTAIGDGAEVVHVNLGYIMLITEGHPGWVAASRWSVATVVRQNQERLHFRPPIVGNSRESAVISGLGGASGGIGSDLAGLNRIEDTRFP